MGSEMCIRDRDDATKGADVFLGLSKGNVLSKDMVLSMAANPIVSVSYTHLTLPTSDLV